MRSGSLSGGTMAGIGGRMVTDRLTVTPTAQSYMPVGERAANSQAPSADGRTPTAAIANGGIARQGRAGVATSGERRDMSRGTPGTPDSLRGEGQNNAVVEQPSASRQSAASDSAAQPVRVWNRVDTPGQGSERSSGSTAPGGEVRQPNPRSTGRNVPGDRGSSQTLDSVPRPSVIERGTAGSASVGRSSYQSGGVSVSGTNAGRSYSVPQSTPPVQRYSGSEVFGPRTGSPETGGQPRTTTPQAAPSGSAQPSVTPAPRSGIERWRSSTGSQGSSLSQPSFGGGRQTTSSAPSIIRSPSTGGRTPVQGMGSGTTPAPRSAPSGGSSGIQRNRNP